VASSSDPGEGEGDGQQHLPQSHGLSQGKVASPLFFTTSATNALTGSGNTPQVVSLLIKTLSKPIANRLKISAQVEYYVSLS
jgi:hypothetical protein